MRLSALLMVVIVVVSWSGEGAFGQKKDLPDKRLDGLMFAGERILADSRTNTPDTLKFFGCEARSSTSRSEGFGDACYLIREIEGGLGFTIQMMKDDGSVERWKGTIKDGLLEAVVMLASGGGGTSVEYQYRGERIDRRVRD